MAIPDWAAKLKGANQAIQKVGKRYYLYDVRYGYDREKQRSKVISKTYVGRLDEEKGIIVGKRKGEPAHRPAVGSPLEYEASNLLEILGKDIRENLTDVFGEEDSALIMAIGKIGVIEKQPEKRIRNAYESSYESVRRPGLPLSAASISRLTERIGRQRDLQLRFMRKYVGESTHLIFDGTRLVCYSKEVDLARIGYNHSQIWDPQVNLMYCFSLRPEKMPVYFMPFAGNKPDISNLLTCVRELGMKNAFLICDKGFRSAENLAELKENGITFLTPLRRDSKEIDYGFMKGKEGSVVPFGKNVFVYHGRPIYYHVCQRYEFEKKEVRKRGRKPKGYVPAYETIRKDMVVLYLDLALKADEDADYALHMSGSSEEFTEEKIAKDMKYSGTIALSVNRDMKPEELFGIYKERELIEDGNKAYKHVLGNFASNKQRTDSYNGWLFLNHISLMLYYRVLGKIKEKGLTTKYSVEDVIDVAKRITMQQIDGQWNENVPALTDMRPYTEIFG